jgi:YHS domain-containing protein
MIRHVFIFIIAAGVGAVAALAVRSAFHQPYGKPPPPAQQDPPPAPSRTTPTADPHAGHAAAPAGKPVNDHCAICGMDADPTLTATYQGKTIAFGCAKCRPTFAKDPERYGPYFLKNEKAP